MKLIPNKMHAQIMEQLNGRIALMGQAIDALKGLQVSLEQHGSQMPAEAKAVCHNIAVTSIGTAEAQREFLELLRDRIK